MPSTGTQYSAWSAYKLPSGASNKRRVRTYYTWTTSETATTFSIAIKAYVQMQGGSATMGGNTVTVSATGRSSVSNTFKFVYGETTLHNPVNKTYTWKKTAASQTVTVKSTYKVASGKLFTGTYVANGTFTIPPLLPATITFNANGGSGSVKTINTYLGVANTIPSNTLTRTGYTFSHWNTKSDGSGTSYATGSSITPLTNVVLYARWKTTYVKPEIQNLLAFRVADESGGASPTVTSTGETGFCKFELVGGANYTFDSASVQFGTATAKSMTRSGNIVYGYSDPDSIAQASAYTVKITVVVTGTDGVSRTYTDSTYISKSVPVFDVASNGNCFAFFGTATDGLTDPKLIINGEMAFGTEADAAVARANLGAVKAEDTGWVNLTTVKGTWSYCQYRYKNGVVYIRGLATAYAWSGSTGDALVANNTIPSQYRPFYSVDLVLRCPGARWGQVVATSEGGIFVDRILNGTTAYTSSNWIRFNGSYLL